MDIALRVQADVRDSIRRLGVDRDAVALDVMHQVAGFGPLQRLFDDPGIEEVWSNEPTWRAGIRRRGIARSPPGPAAPATG